MPTFKTIHQVTSLEYLHHDTGGEDHPEQPERLKAIARKLSEGPLAPTIVEVAPVAASREDILAVHDDDYLLRFEDACLSGREYFGHSDNRICYETWEIAFLSAGAGITGIELIEASKSDLVFCSVRPPGHHAEAGLPLGFCFFNNVAVAAKYWQATYGRERILIFDFDAHHGNGIQEIFDEDPGVMYVSMHEHPTFSFPGTGWDYEQGTGPGKGFTLNVPLPPGAGDDLVLQALAEKITPAVEQFRPECIIIAAGFDAHGRDDMSGLDWTTVVYGRLGTTIANWADRFTDGRVLSILEGGYVPEALAASVETYLGGLSLVV